jgi:hypothetical protein
MYEIYIGENKMSKDFRDEWLLNLGKRMGLPTLKFDDSGLCQLSLDQELALTLYRPEETEKLVVFGQLPTPPLSQEMMKQMLIENRSSARLLAPIISLSQEEDAIEIHLQLDQRDLEQGDEGLEQVVAALEYWRTATTRSFDQDTQEDTKDDDHHHFNFV